jgi:hypothetical protein
MAQLSLSGPTFFVFALLLLPGLCVLGVETFMRVVVLLIEDETRCTLLVEWAQGSVGAAASASQLDAVREHLVRQRPLALVCLRVDSP